jgi:fructose-bisphosphate aldolase class I
MEGLPETAKKMMASGKGIFAADASVKSISARLDKNGIGYDEETRRKYRELLFTSPGLSQYISGIIMHDESIRQATAEGKFFRQIIGETGMIVGIKVDRGTVDLVNFPGEKAAEGLDGLRERLAEYVQMGAGFTKWRVVIQIGEGRPTREAIKINAGILARYAALSQEAGLVPIVEPEVIMEGTHTADRCAEVTELVGKLTIEALSEMRVKFPGTIYKVNMVLPGRESGAEIDDGEMAKKTVEVLNKVIPADMAGVVFLSGGQNPIEATRRLNAIERYDKTAWPMTFSFERALENRVMEVWQGRDENKTAAQETLVYRAKMNSLAVLGKYEGEEV